MAGLIQYDQPHENIAEVTLIGAGSGYGESCIIHFGNGEWGVVDSCIDPRTGECLPLNYLQKIGVDIANKLKFILCTHWHEDHIKGLPDLLKVANNAVFFFARPTDANKFWEFIANDAFRKPKLERSTRVFADCLNIIDEKRMKLVSPDRVLYTDPVKNVRVTSLSPSDFVCNEYDKEIISLINSFSENGSKEKVIIHKPNDKSIVLLLELFNHNVILGADLEVSEDVRKGWLNIILESEVVKGKVASLFKIPHHGSENGYHDEIWNVLLSPKPTSKLTTYNKKKGLPTEEMVELYKKKSQSLYITSDQGSKFIKRHSSVSSQIKEENNTLVELKFSLGIIRSRIQMNDFNANWDVSTDGSAIQII